MMSGNGAEGALQEILEISTVIDGQIYVAVSVLEAIRDTFIEKIMEGLPPPMWVDGVASVLDLLQEIIDSLTYEYAEELVPDAVPENL
jgi:hypothetical protein